MGLLANFLGDSFPNSALWSSWFSEKFEAVVVVGERSGKEVWYQSALPFAEVPRNISRPRVRFQRSYSA